MQLNLDIEKLNHLLRSFHDISGVRIGVFDRDANALLAYPESECEFCRILKTDVRFRDRCIKNDREAVLRALNGQLWVYRCHAGLCEAVIPILCDNTPIACLMIGQTVSEHSQERQTEDLQTRLQGHPEIDRLFAAFQSIPQRSEREIESCAQIMAACAGYIYLNSMIYPQQASLSARLYVYIRANYSRPLTLGEMAAQLDVSVSRLCAAVRAESGTTPHAMLTKVRIQKAMEYLKQTKLSVSEIASKVGISDYNYFSRVFRKEAGLPPTAFRKKQ